jgi:hypothetical protein
MRNDNWNPWTIIKGADRNDIDNVGVPALEKIRNGITKMPDFKFANRTIRAVFSPQKLLSIAQMMIDNPDISRVEACKALGTVAQVKEDKSSDDPSLLRLLYCLLAMGK